MEVSEARRLASSFLNKCEYWEKNKKDIFMIIKKAAESGRQSCLVVVYGDVSTNWIIVKGELEKFGYNVFKETESILYVNWC